MILWFLGLFSAFRDLQNSHAMLAGIASDQDAKMAEVKADRDSFKSDFEISLQRCRDLEAENIRLQDRVDAANEDRAKLWAMLQEALGNERKALMMEVNAKWQKDYGVTPFPDAPSIPEKFANAVDAVTEFGRQGRLLPSEMVANAEKEYWLKRVNRQVEDARKQAEVANLCFQSGVNG